MLKRWYLVPVSCMHVPVVCMHYIVYNAHDTWTVRAVLAV
jgi:hypothetical protein